MKKLIAQGAEAKIYLENNEISKERIQKSYRLPELDEKIRKARTRQECRILSRANKFANVPKVLNADKKGFPNDKFNLKIEFIKGDRLSETLNNYKEKKQLEIMKQLGNQVALLHKNEIIHGDLTTSNVILSNSSNKIFIIDFGLGFISKKIEDKGVDLHLIKQALEAKHFQNWKTLFDEFLKGYNLEDKDKVLERLKAIEKRGRYRH